MQKNWYIIYTKKSLENKVSRLLTKKKIENFFPVNCRQVDHFRSVKTIYEPLLQGYVFVCVPAKDLPMLQQIPNVINTVYWKGQPALIQKEEIEILEDFIIEYRNIKVERVKVGVGELKIINNPIYDMEGNHVIVKANLVKVHLPSLGFVMTAENKREDNLQKQSIFSIRAKVSTVSTKKNLKTLLN